MDPTIYKSNIGAWRTIWRGEGLRGIFFGWTPTLVGYSLQGMGKYGCYEVFKYLYGERLFPNANKTVVYLAASASAEFFADIALCPWEAIKVRMQTTLPPYASSLREGWSKVVAKEGYSGLVFYKIIYQTSIWPCPQTPRACFPSSWPCRNPPTQRTLETKPLPKLTKEIGYIKVFIPSGADRYRTR